MSEENGNLNNGSDGSQNNEGEGAQPAWTAQLSDDLKTNEGLTRFKTISDLGNAYIDSQGKLQNAVHIPGENASSDEKSSFLNRLGRPEAASGYELEKPELPEGYQYDESFEGKFKDVAHEEGLSKTAAKGLYKKMMAHLVSEWKVGQESLKNADSEAESNLKNDWGVNFDRNTEQARRAENKFKGDHGDFIKLMEDAGLNTHPAYRKFMNGLFSLYSDDTWVEGDSRGSEQKGPKTGAYGKPILNFPSMQEGNQT